MHCVRGDVLQGDVLRASNSRWRDRMAASAMERRRPSGHASVPTHKKIFAALDLPVLAALLGDAGLKFVDIGGRDAAFQGLVPLASLAHYYVSEPDVAEAKRLRELLPRVTPWRSVTVIDRAMASRPGEASLHLTSSPGMSSLLEPNPEVTRRYCLAHKYGVQSVVNVPAFRDKQRLD